MKLFEITKLPPYLIIQAKRFNKNTFVTEKNHNIIHFSIKSIDFGKYLSKEARTDHTNTTYDLIASVVQDGEPDKRTYRILYMYFIKQPDNGMKCKIYIVTEILPQMRSLSEAYIQVCVENKIFQCFILDTSATFISQ